MSPTTGDAAAARRPSGRVIKEGAMGGILPSVRSLSGQILVATLGIVTTTLVIGLVLYARATSAATEEQATREATDIAVSVAAAPPVATLLTSGDPDHRLAGFGEAVRARTDATYVVLIDAHGKRFSHPNPDLVGRSIEEPVIALDGRVHTGLNAGSLGDSASAWAPVLDTAGTPVGEVSVGILQSEVAARFRQQLGLVAGYSAVALLLGVLGSLALARRIKRVTFGLEPREIVALLHEREATLNGIREGVLALDADQRVTVVNDEARRLLDAPALAVGAPIGAALEPGRLRDLIDGSLDSTTEAATGDERPDGDVAVLGDDRLLTLNRMPVVVAGRRIGSVVTLRDRSEFEEVIRQLRETAGIAEALRAQAHDHSNRMHTIGMLLELGELGEARAYADRLRTERDVADRVRDRIASPVVAALLLAKMTVAAERGVQVRLDPGSRLDRATGAALPLVTLLGNLVDNAIEATAGSGSATPRVVEVCLRHRDDLVRLAVADSGPGIPHGLRDAVFEDGWTTKPAAGPARRGIGLALVRRIVVRHGGRVWVESAGPPLQGACLVVDLPVPGAGGGPTP